MKTGLTLKQLAIEIKRRQGLKEDLIAPISKLRMLDDGKILVDGKRGGRFDVNAVAGEQIANLVGIPMPYYRRMVAEAPALLATNVNRWFEDKANERRMIRLLGPTVRAVLSDKYRTLEYEDVAEAVLPVLLERDMIVMSSQITDSRLYIKAVDRSIEQNIPRGAAMGDGSHHIFDTVSPAIIISDSEVGRGSLSIEAGVFTLACTNLAIFGAKMKKYHTGARAEMSDDVYAMLSDSTKRLTDAAVWAQAKDVVANALDRAKFEATCRQLTDASEQRIGDDVVEVVEQVGRHFNINEGERKGVLAALIEGGDLSRYGVHSAITRFSQKVEDYDRATELERTGAQVITMGEREWQRLADAA